MESQETLSVVSTLIELIQKSLPIIGIALIASLYIWSWKRAGSAFFILQRFWALLGGNKELNDPELNSAWNQVKDFYSIRLRTGIHFKSKIELTHSLQWLKGHKIGLEEIIPIRIYFDTTNLEIREPDFKSKKRENWFSGLFLTVLFITSTILFIPDYALLSVKKTDTLFWATDGRAYSWNLASWSTNSENCKKQEFVDASYDNKVICELITKPKNAFIKKTIFQQRTFGVFTWTLTVFFLLSLITSWSKAKRAYELRAKTHTPSSIQLELF